MTILKTDTELYKDARNNLIDYIKCFPAKLEKIKSSASVLENVKDKLVVKKRYKPASIFRISQAVRSTFFLPGAASL